jgi:RimJ/RimL family protein N-acetyltransferase
MLVHDLEQIPQIEPGDYPLIKKLIAEEVEMLNDVWPVDVNKMRQRLKETSVCYITKDNNACASYHWLQVRGNHFIQQLGIHAQLPEKQAMIYHTRVAEHAKGKGINGYVLKHILRNLKSDGFQKVWIYTNQHNTANQKGLKACGFVEFGRFTSIEYYHDKFLGLTPFRFPTQ